MRISTTGIVLGTLLACSACSSENPQQALEEVPPIEEALENQSDGESRTHVLSVVETPNSEVTFLEHITPEGDSAVMYTETAPIEIGMTALGKLTLKQELTTLEVFEALTDEEPPQALLDAHAEEAMAMGRPDAAVLDIEVDFEVLVPKYTNAQCDDAVFWDTTPVSQIRRWNNKTTNPALYTIGQAGREPANDFNYGTTKKVRFGWCNDGTATLDNDIWFIYLTGGSSWQEVLVPDTPGGFWRTFSLRRTLLPFVPTAYLTEIRNNGTGLYQYDVRSFELN